MTIRDARLRELALMAQRYAELGEFEKAKRVLNWSPTLKSMQADLVKTWPTTERTDHGRKVKAAS